MVELLILANMGGGNVGFGNEVVPFRARQT